MKIADFLKLIRYKKPNYYSSNDVYHTLWYHLSLFAANQILATTRRTALFPSGTCHYLHRCSRLCHQRLFRHSFRYVEPSRKRYCGHKTFASYCTYCQQCLEFYWCCSWLLCFVPYSLNQTWLSFSVHFGYFVVLLISF